MDILKEIIENKYQEVMKAQQKHPEEKLPSRKDNILRSMKQALEVSATGIIAEFKRRSPSKGWIQAEARIEEVVPDYEQAGAVALSVLTDSTYFGARPDDLSTAREMTRLPILRKDFITEPYQIAEAYAYGADAILLIAACLSHEKCQHLANVAHGLGLEVLLELHSTDELDYTDIPTEMLGVNNRCLGTFQTDIRHAAALASKVKQRLDNLPPDKQPILIAESGISCPEDLVQLRDCGYRGFLIGERFMRARKPGKELEQFINQLTNI